MIRKIDKNRGIFTRKDFFFLRRSLCFISCAVIAYLFCTGCSTPRIQESTLLPYREPVIPPEQCAIVIDQFLDFSESYTKKGKQFKKGSSAALMGIGNMQIHSPHYFARRSGKKYPEYLIAPGHYALIGVGTTFDTQYYAESRKYANATVTLGAKMGHTYLISHKISGDQYQMSVTDLGKPPVRGFSPTESFSTVVDSKVATDRFRDNGDGTVTDTTTGLQWMRCALGQRWRNGRTCTGRAEFLNWDTAILRAASHQFAGHSDWRLPTRDELRGLVYCSSGHQRAFREDSNGRTVAVERGVCLGNHQTPTICIAAFPNTPRSAFWSSSSLASNSDADSAWSVSFEDGWVAAYTKRSFLRVRLVRADSAPPQGLKPPKANNPIDSDEE